MKKQKLKALPKAALSWLLTLVMVIGLCTGFAPMIAEAAEVSSTGYTYGVDEDTFNERIEKILASVYMGEYPTGHMQGFAIDDEMKYIYASFTTKLAKVDIETGEVVGVVHNWSGHLGDMAYYDGRVYGSLEYKSQNSFYIAVFDCDKIVGDVDHTECMRTMYLPEVSKDFTATIDGVRYAYGCSGIDGVAFGKIPGDDSGEIVMMVAYGIFTDASTNVQDRDYQVLLQYDLSSFLESDGNGGTQLIEDRNDVLDQSNYHKQGPEHEDKYFIYTGNTNYGIQNLEYDTKSGNYCMAVYRGTCAEFPNYGIYYLDGDSVPVVQDLIMSPARFAAYEALPNTNPGCTHMAEGKVLQLADNNGSSDGSATLSYQDCNPGFGEETYRIWGSNTVGRNPSTGLDHIYGDYFYISQSGGGLTGGQIGYAHLYKYDRDKNTFTLITQPAPAAKELLSYSMDASDLYTKDGVTYMKNGVDDNNYAAVVEGTASSVGVSGAAGGSLAFNGWNYPAEPDQVYLDDETIAYLNREIGTAKYSYSYSFWAKMATGGNTDGNFQPIVGFYREDGTYINVFEQRWRTQMKPVINGVGTAKPGSSNAGTTWATTVGNPTTGNPGDGGSYITNPADISGAGAWIFYTITENNGSVTVYENGKQVKTYTTTTNHMVVEPITDFIIGGGSAKLWLDMNNRGRLIGSVDDVTIWSGVLTADEVAAEYAKVTTKETSGVPAVRSADKAEAPSANIVYLSYDLTADAGNDLVVNMGANVDGLAIPGLTAGTDYVASGTTLTIKAAWLAKQECGIISQTISGITVKLTITNTKFPVLSYTFSSGDVSNGVVEDSSVYGVDAIANNIAAFGESHTGIANGSIFFNGHNYKDPTYVKLSTDDAAWLNSVLEDGYTINFWAKAQAENGNKMSFAGLYADDARPLGVIETNDGNGSNTAIDGVMTVQVNAAVDGTQTAQDAKAASAAEVGEWAMYTATYDKASNTVKLYVNGEETASSTVADDIIGEISQLFIGHSYKKYYYSTTSRDWTTRGGFYGLMDSFEVYNYALSAAEINTLASGGSIQPAVKTDPVVHWTMDASSLNGDGTMTDSSPNGLTSYFQNVTPVAGVDGTAGGALYFDGSADAGDFSRVWLSDEGISALNTAVDNKITVTFWMKPDYASQGEGYPYTGTWTPVGGVFGESDNRFLMVSEFRYNKLCYCIQAGGDKHTAAGALSDDKWYFVVMTYDGTKTEASGTLHDFYIVDPTSGATIAPTGSERTFTNTDLFKAITHLEFGGQYAKGHWQDTNVRGRYIGAIDDIKVYNISVTTEDVAKLVANKPVTGEELTLSGYEFEVNMTEAADVVIAVENANALTSVSGLSASGWNFSNGIVTLDVDALELGKNELVLTFDTGVKTVSVTLIDDRTYFTPKVITFEKASPADITFSANVGFGTPTSVSADGLTADDYTISGRNITIKKEWLIQQQPGTVEITVTVESGETRVATIHVTNTISNDTTEPYPVLYYPMDKAGLSTVTNANGTVDGTLADASGNGIDLQIGGLTSAVAGADSTANGSIYFDSYREHDISYGYLNNDGTDYLAGVVGDEITFSFWHKSDRISSNLMPVLGLYAEDGRPLLLAEFYAGTGAERSGKSQATTPTLTATVSGSIALNTNVLRSSATVTMNSTWHHYVMTYNNTTGAAVLYVDGTQMASGTLPAGQLDSVDTFIIGTLDDADYYNAGTSSSRTAGMAIQSHGRLHGYLDEIKVYNVALSAEDVADLFSTDSFGLEEDTTGVKVLDSIEITAPAKVEYGVGDELDVTGGKVTVKYTDGTSTVIDMTADMVSGFDSSLGVEDQVLTVTYTLKDITKTDTFTVDIIKKLAEIQVSTLPSKLVYEVNEALDVTGGKVTVTYDDGTTKVIDLTADMVSGFDSSLGGSNLATITYTEDGVTKTTTLGLTIEKELASIELTTLPSTLEYGVGDELDVTGGKVTLTYNDGTTEEIDLVAGMVSGFTSALGVEDLELTVTYGAFTDTYTVDIIKELVSIAVNGFTTRYTVDSTLNVKGATVIKTYDDGTTETVALTEDMVSGFNSDSTGTIPVTITVDGVSTTLNVTIYESSATGNNSFVSGGGAETTCPSEKFVDLDTTKWYHAAADYVILNGIMNGTGNGTTFSPYMNLTRGMMMTMLARLDGVDTSGGSVWYERGMTWAMAQGVSDGTNPEGNITREQMVTMLYRYVGGTAVSVNHIANYTDGNKVSSWAVEAMNWAIANGVITGKGNGILDPQGAATRIEVAQVLMNYFKK